MGIKMDKAYGANGSVLHAGAYEREKGNTPMRCYGCATQVDHQRAHIRELKDKSVPVPAFFKLHKGHQHGPICQFGIDGKVKVIADESQGLLESIKKGKYELRLLMIKEALEELGSTGGSADRPTGGSGHVGLEFETRDRTLRAYINTAQRVLELRTLCDEEAAIADLITLKFQGNIVIPWSQFYFNDERFHEAYATIKNNTVPHPIALAGMVKGLNQMNVNGRTRHAMNLELSGFRQTSEQLRTSIGVSVWSNDAFPKYQKGDDVLVLGIWRAKPGTPRPDACGHRDGDQVVFNNLELNLILSTQIAKIKLPKDVQ